MDTNIILCLIIMVMLIIIIKYQIKSKNKRKIGNQELIERVGYYSSKAFMEFSEENKERFSSELQAMLDDAGGKYSREEVLKKVIEIYKKYKN
ncbi:hypothetical protein D9V86_07290 [Bacteroidetes/Chlorobi group bacterium ChocPot_Mid]|nr:MAG: hypothetical protein D9V86_07290 [Bacteroidetes/Chlorobi group bacterium ChocPot_Mid]